MLRAGVLDGELGPLHQEAIRDGVEQPAREREARGARDALCEGDARALDEEEAEDHCGVCDRHARPWPVAEHQVGLLLEHDFDRMERGDKGREDGRQPRLVHLARARRFDELSAWEQPRGALLRHLVGLRHHEHDPAF
eukprot:CAMPEP_0180133660 /NCGR_PEP_ID=MMETSP0986-20121125/9669_1 /TAXON_ID=697907 /ORGANISM="non described non described, Strain CCMP2293" /LENGTH=137 /DNA_ID=CAMNT_0022073813 /DNA_START=516 /DNA_END=929 /DNA_ORIENTATION=-